MKNIKVLFCFFLIPLFGLSGTSLTLAIDNPHLIGQPQNVNLSKSGSTPKIAQSLINDPGIQITSTGLPKFDLDWSPDNERIVYEQQGDIFIMKPEGSIAVNLTRDIDGYCSLPWFSDTSAGITFTNYRQLSGTYALEYISILRTGYTVILEGIGVASWSNNGRYLAYRDIGTSELVIYDYLLDTIKTIGAGDQAFGNICFSPDDKYVVTSMLDNNLDAKLFRIPVGGGNAEQLTFNEGYHWEPEYSPDGKWIMYTDQTTMMLLAYNTETLESQPVFEDPGNSVGRFSEDGSQFCYLREIDGNNEVFVADFKTSDPLVFVEVISPNGGEILSAGQSIEISWDTSGIANVNIEYTTDGGTNWNPIADGINARFGEYNWLVPEVDSNRCRIRIASVALTNLVADQSNGNFTISTSAEQDGLVFKYQTGNEISLSSPAIGEDGTIYIGSKDGLLYALNPNGTLKWKYSTNGPIWSSPAIGSNGVIYIGSDDTALHAVNPNGTGKWKYLTDGEIWASPAIGNNGDIYFSSFDNIFYALKSDGTKKWEYEIGTMMISSPSISLSGNIYFGAIDGNLYALRTDGTLKWSFPTDAEIYSSPAIGDDGTVYVGNNNSMYAVNPDGTKKWYTYFENVVESSPAIGEDGTIYVGVDDGNLYALNPYNGSIIWSFAAEDMIVSSPAVGNDGTIYVGSNEGVLYAISPDGNKKWQYVADGGIWSSPTINDSGTLYFGSYDFHLYAVDSKTTQGLADSAWPKFRNNTLNTGKKFSESLAYLLVTYPDGGENLLPGTNVDITWSFNGVTNIIIQYSDNNGLSWNKIVDNIPASNGTYKWSIPQGIDSSECLIRVIDSTDSTVKDKSNNQFSISPTAYLKLTSRIGGEKLSIGGTYTIKWDSYSISSIDIKYSTDGGTTWKNISSGVSAEAGSYTWSIPTDYSDNCKIMIADSSNSSVSESSIGAFSIQSNEFITITSPKFGDRWTAQSTKEITWEFNGILYVKIEYSTDNGATWQTIIASTSAATGSYGWSVPDIEKNQCFVRITDTANSVNTDDSDRFEIIKPELTITHTPVTTAQENDTITFSAVISSEDSVESVTLFYDKTGIRNFSEHEVSMVSTDGMTYSTTLDVGIFTAHGLEYYILAKDVNNQNTRTPADNGYYSISATVSDMTSTETTSGGSVQDSYRMISIPLMIDSSYDTIEKQMSGLLPEGDTGSDWRLFRYSPGETAPSEYPEIETFTPGAAFWLISKNDFLFKAPSGSTVSTSGTYTITLKAGWNDIANPWMFDISWDDIENPSGATLSSLYTYNGSWSDPTNPPTTLEAWKGYAVNNMTNMNVIIKLNPTLSESTGKPAVRNDDISWQLSVNASAGRAKDNSNHFGLRQGALDEWDMYDHIEPPAIGEYVSVAFPHSDWERFPQSYTVDFRPHTSKDLSWDFTVTTNIPNEKIHLDIEGADDLPEGYDYIVIDRTNGTLISLEDDSFSFISGSGITEKLFTVTVGGEITRDSREYSTLPESFITARCYPNPFNPSTTIQYELPQPGNVFFTVFNSIGQIVHKNDIGQKEQGTHSFVFDASEMISGIYFYSIESGGASVTNKMVFMK
ncbi:PQQ-binding-like beta-propeller repeat protein [Candidatus Latescibacterota bacterium]